jgi:hypothetical protein
MQGWPGMNWAEVGHWPAGTMMHPAAAVQQAPRLFGQGAGTALQETFGENVAPAGHWVWRTKTQPPAALGMQQAPRGTLGHGFGEQDVFARNVPPSETHSDCVAEMHWKTFAPVKGL